MSTCASSSSSVEWSSQHSGVLLTAVGGAAEIEVSGLSASAFVRLISADDGAAFWSWTITDLDADCAFGISTDEDADVLGDGLTNLFYCSDGRLVKNGAVVRTGPVLSSGDTLTLYLDAESEKALFMINGIPI